MVVTKDHYIQLKDGQLDGTSVDDLTHLFKTLDADYCKDHIVLHFHGGLVDATSAMQTAENLTHGYQYINIYQIFFIWETGIFDVIQQEGGLIDFIQRQLTLIGQDTLFVQLLMRILQFAKAKVDSINSQSLAPVSEELVLPTDAFIWKNMLSLKDGREPFANVHPVFPVNKQLPDVQKLQFSANAQLSDVQKQQFRNVLASDQTIHDEVRNILTAHRSRSATSGTEYGGPGETTIRLMSLPILKQMDQQSDNVQAPDIEEAAFLDLFTGTVLGVLSQVLARFAQQTDHGLYPTVVEEILRAYYLSHIGKDIWEHIKQETLDAFTPPTPDLPTPGAAVFVQKLHDYYYSQKPEHRPQITLVGHSAGSIFICRLLQHLKDVFPPEVKFNVVFLAPACTYTLFAETLQACKDYIAAIRIFAMSDPVEQSDELVPGIYTRSLLYLVSGLFEDTTDIALLGMQRFFSSEPPFNTRPDIPGVLDYLRLSQHNDVWSIADGGNGLSSHATHHGDFYSEWITLMSLAYILTNGLL